MSRGTRPRAEFVEDLPRRLSRSPNRREPITSPDPSHIDIRVTRPIKNTDLSDSVYVPYEDDWDNFLKKLGKTNHQFGKARSLGSVAITLLPSTRLNMVLRDSRPKEFFNSKKKTTMFRRVASHMTDFIRETGQTNSQIKLEQMRTAHDTALAAAIYRDDLGLDLTDDELLIIDGQNIRLSASESDSMNEHAFGSLALAASGFELYGRRYGVDLTTNEQLFDERSSLITFLRRDLRLDTSALQQNVRMHASIFDLHDHVGYPILSYDYGTLPPVLVSDLPKVEHYDFHNNDI